VDSASSTTTEETKMDEQVCSCGSTEDVIWSVDPFQAEINEDYTEMWICGKCYEVSFWEI
jgi:hypothetical protein